MRFNKTLSDMLSSPRKITRPIGGEARASSRCDLSVFGAIEKSTGEFSVRSILNVLVGVVAATACLPSLAGTETGTVRFNYGQYRSSSTSAGLTFFFLDGGTKSDIPACSTAFDGERWVINNDWPVAKMQMAVLLAAATSGKKVTIRGTGECGVYSNSETAQDIFLAE